MISYVKGKLVEIIGDTVVVENGGFGINIRVPESVLSQLPGIGSETLIYTYMYVKEDLINLFGFITRDDLNVFKLLLNVNGIGPRGALSILSTVTPDALRLAVLSGDIKLISSAPGIGKKTAERLVLELKDKVSVSVAPESIVTGSDIEQTAVGEAVEALETLGISRSEAEKAIRSIEGRENMSAEELIKEGLRNLA
ncbi:MAG: Holliday junction branch migration protein RuvA [Clostridiales bacterium]|nr:Holliday junction branch migration protein RuvA [Clostridiales bacterium]MBS5877445.1 Holliday junction branch migration protein RuvA [Clostridiales bacterium]MDU0938832.1 Holliday junction branch migration protein RuvA [Clostridiales bacterium]MDU1041528.1 Holliday junction branch migration protein RuvA [Clostridiales bacterium]MDU3489819.1 Holliday junction branch migration protein RuvA [Clostridiales bacterium]